MPHNKPFAMPVGKKEFFILLLVLAATFAVMSSVLFNDFTNLDDRAHVVNNPQIRSLGWENIKTIFTSTVIAGYIPLTILSFAVEYHFFGLNPFVFHLDNLLLHVIVTALIFWLGLRLGLNAWASGLAALLFGIHPMHVESVAWISERKDVLYAVFYLLALHSYLTYIKRCHPERSEGSFVKDSSAFGLRMTIAEKGHKSFFVLTIVFGILSMLAKSMALSLPLILWVLDWMKGRRLTVNVLLEKIPYFVYIVPIAWLTYTGGYVEPLKNPPLEAFLTWIWSAMFYIWKFFVPLWLSPVYARPEPIALLNPSYLAAILSVIVCVWLLIRFRSHRWLIFAALFYFLSIFFLFPFNAFKFNVVNDRYMYLPSVGLCFLFGFWVRQGFLSLEKRRAQKYIALACVAILFTALSVKTFFQCKIWKDSLMLFSEIIRHNPDNWFALYNRAKTYEQEKKFDLALADYSQAIAIKADYGKAYNNRGAVLLSLGRDSEAFEDLNKAIQLDANFAEAYSNRSVIYLHRRQHELALADLNKALELQPRLANARVRLGTVRARLGLPEHR